MTTGLAVSAFNLAESHVHRSVFDFTFQTFLVPSSTSETIEQTTPTTDVLVLNKFQTLSQNSGNASFVSHSLQVIVPTLGGCVVSALRDVAGGSFLGEEVVGTATSRPDGGGGGFDEGGREQKAAEDIECGSRRCEENGAENSRRGGNFRHGGEFRTGRTERGDWRGGE